MVALYGSTPLRNACAPLLCASRTPQQNLPPFTSVQMTTAYMQSVSSRFSTHPYLYKSHFVLVTSCFYITLARSIQIQQHSQRCAIQLASKSSFFVSRFTLQRQRNKSAKRLTKNASSWGCLEPKHRFGTRLLFALIANWVFREETKLTWITSKV